MLDWLDRLIGMANDRLPEESKYLVRLAVISILIAIIWLGTASSVSSGAIAWAPALAFAFLALATLVVVNVRTMAVSQEKPRNIPERSRDPVPPGYHIGCRIGRRRLECGLLRVTGETTALPEAGQVGPVCEPDDVTTLSKSLRRLIFDRDLRRLLAEGARNQGRKLPDWPAQCRLFAEALAAPS